MINAWGDPRRSPSKRYRWGAALGIGGLVGTLSFAAMSGSASGGGWEAVAVLRDVEGNKVGKVTFEGDEHGTEVKATMHGVAIGLDGYHGFHLHGNDAGGACDPSVGFTNVGGHWNPTGADHGHHAGDLPTILVLGDGTAMALTVTGRFEPGEIAGRAVIVHGGPDNYANIPSRYETGGVAGPDSATKGTGDAGGRIACGIVELD